MCVAYVLTMTCVLADHVLRHTFVEGNSVAGHAGDVTIQACPARLTAASPIDFFLDASTSILTLNLTAQIHH